ncbi:MAG: substrate-binding domain-containing protein [Hyphomicrobiaceae bacterium]
MAITVLSAGAVKGAVTCLAETFKQQTGEEISFRFGTAGNVRQRLSAGEAGDVVIATEAALQLMARDGLIVVETACGVGRTLTGVCVPAGREHPPLASIEDFRRLLLDVRSFAYTDPAAGGTSGTFFAGLLERLELTGQVASKAVLCRGGEDVARTVAAGRADAGSTFISEMIPVAGVGVVGPLPDEIGNETGYSGAVLSVSRNAPMAARFLDMLVDPNHRRVWAGAGFL